MKQKTAEIVDRAIEWGRQRLGAAEYRGLCYLFVEDCYEHGNGIVLDGKGTTAKEAADAYGCRQGEAPKGAYVFFDCTGPLNGETRNWGHIGVALGDGSVIHAWDVVRIDSVEEIEELTPPADWSKPKCLGWAPADLILKGGRDDDPGETGQQNTPQKT
jgi:cell wall-associated NlpC family hydrolase